MKPTTKEVEKALTNVLNNSEVKALDYCVGYAEHALDMISANEPYDRVKVQILYVLSNMAHWRGGAARETKTILRNFIQ